jgi:hypothetical protein
MKRRWENRVQIIDKTHVCAFAKVSTGRYGDGKIIVICEDDGIKILCAEGELDEHGGLHAFGTIIGDLTFVVPMTQRPQP